MNPVLFSIKKKLTKAEVLFTVYYFLFFLSLFLQDVNFPSGTPETLIRGIKFLVVLFLIAHAGTLTWKKDVFKRFIFSIVVGGIFLIASGDFFWIIILLMGYISSTIDEDILFRLSYKFIFYLSIVVLLLCAASVLPDTLNGRTDLVEANRHSLGFIHSTVLPLGVFYATIFIVFIRKYKLKKSFLFFSLLLSLVLYYFCGSRNGVVGEVLLCIAIFIDKGLHKNRGWNKFCRFLANIAMIFFSIVSILPSYLRSEGILMPLWYILDTVFTNRTLLGSSAISRLGIHLVSLLSSEEYQSTIFYVDSWQRQGIVLDSAYMYLAVRYGILALLLVITIYFSVVRNFKWSSQFCLCLFLIAMVNMTDNDILSYGFLPFMLVGVRNLWEFMENRKKGKIKANYKVVRYE